MDNGIYGYARVSDAEQAKKGYSIGEQIELITKAAYEVGDILNPENVYSDKGYTGTKLNRPKIQELIRIVSQGKVEKIYILCSDRLTRDNIHKESLKCVFQKFNVKIISIADKWVMNSDIPEEEFASDLKTLLDKLESKKISPRTIRGLRASAKLGNYTIGNIAPRGYKRVCNEKLGKGSYILPIPEFIKYVRYVFISLAERKHTRRSIARLYDKHRIMGLRWTERAIESMIMNHIYYGRLLTSYCDIRNHTVSMITEDEFLACHEGIKITSRRTKHFYIYNNLVYCDDCVSVCIQDCAYKTSRNGKKKTLYMYYKCPVCKHRINQNDITKKLAVRLQNRRLPEDKLETLEMLYHKIEHMNKRLQYLDNDYDDSLLDDSEYREKHIHILNELKNMKKEIQMIQDSRIEDFDKLSDYEKRRIIIQNIRRIYVSMSNKNIKSIRVEFVSEHRVAHAFLDKVEKCL